MASGPSLTWNEFQQAVAMVVEALESMHVQFGIIGGAAMALIRDYKGDDQIRLTRDIDLIVQPDMGHRINAEAVSKRLLEDFPSQFETVTNDLLLNVSIPAARITRDDGTQILVEVEIFDVDSWPHRSQYDLNKTRNSRVPVRITGGRIAFVLSPVWMLREKIITLHQRAGSSKEKTDLQDIYSLMNYAEHKAVVMESVEEIQALEALLEKRPKWKGLIEAAIQCPAVFGN